MKRILVLASAALFMTGCQTDNGTPSAPAGDVDAGRAFAETHCIGCHGMDGRGVTLGIPHLAAQEAKYLHTSLIAYREGRRFHAALRDMTKEMTDEDMNNVVAFFSGLPPLGQANADFPDIVIKTPYERGTELAASCAECHGADGNSTIPGIPSLAGQQPRYFVTASQAYLHGLRDIDTMEESLRGLSSLDLENLALYYASQEPALRDEPAIGDPAAGEALSAQCGGCHGAHGVSHDSATPTLAGQDVVYLAKATRAYKNHTRHHDVMLADTTDEEIENIAAFYSIQVSRPAELGNVSAQQLIDMCDRCHGIDVDHSALSVPKINGQDIEYLARSLRAYRDDRRESSMMHKMALPYSDTMIEAVATIYAARPAN